MLNNYINKITSGRNTSQNCLYQKLRLSLELNSPISEEEADLIIENELYGEGLI